MVPLVLLLGAGSAWADAYKCVDPDGRVTYSGTRIVPSCERVQSDRVSVIPAISPAPAARKPEVAPETPRGDTHRAEILARLGEEEAALTEAQRVLDEESAVRRGEEANYQRVLDRLQPYKDKVAQHQRNVEALRQEIHNLR